MHPAKDIQDIPSKIRLPKRTDELLPTSYSATPNILLVEVQQRRSVAAVTTTDETLGSVNILGGPREIVVV